MVSLNQSRVVVLFAALTLGGFACSPQPMGTPCVTASDCAAPADPCVENTCIDKVCGTSNVASGTRVGTQTTGDCKASECDGSGHTVVVNDDSDVRNDSQECTADLCTAGVPSNPPRAEATACGTAGMLKCDGQGACVTCLAAADCGPSSECQTRTCVAGVCGVNNVARGTALASQTAGDCKVNQCNGTGSTELVNDDADVNADATSCTTNVCTAGVPSNPPVAAGTVCSEGTGTLCDGAGACVACVAATDCPGTDGECQQRTCTAGVCGFRFTARNTPVASQTASDCKVNACDGAGAVIVENDNTDVPNDNNTCTTDTCVAGAPSFSNVANGTSCGTAGVCNAGACVGCNAPSDCPGTDDECKARTCVANVCGFSFTAANTLVAAQTPNDCKKNACDGSGNIVNQNDNADLPADDGNQCTTQVCTAGVPSFPAAAVNTVCTQNGGSFCSAAGTCVACTAPSQCPGTDTECHARTCVANVCGVSNTVAGTVTSSQTAGDCKQNQCDGAGGIVAANLNSDLPADDGNQCTDQACTAGVPSFPPTAVNTACGPGGGSFCSGAGACVACTAPSQCPGSDTECHARTCTANVCGVSNTASGTVTSSQTTGDCKQNQCDGAGAIVAVNQNADVPADDGNQCTTQSCNAGVPTFPAAAVNTACNQGGGSFCNATSTCVACNAPSQCPGSDTECQARTCVANTCGVSNTASGTVTSAQTAGDCKQNQCDGAGAIVAVNQNGDVPAEDGNQCTAQVCNAGVPSFPSVPVDTACNQNGGSFCSSIGACVACNAPSQCAGSDTECQARTCAGNTCGVANTASGTLTSAQTAGDCKVNQCDGSGNIVVVTSSADVPADDGNQCTSEVCVGAVPSHPVAAVDTACNQNGGSVCSSSGSCVACNTASQCPGQDTECTTRTCASGTCGANNTAPGFAVAAQVTGDCKQAQCDGAGNIINANFDTDLPVDLNQCTADVCNAGVPSNPVAGAGVACNQNGGTACDGAGACVAPPAVASTSPADATTPIASPSIGVTFTVAMNPATLTAQTAAGSCSGSIQVSIDNFATCIAFPTGAVMSGGNTTATFTAAPGLLVNRTYKIRVTTAASSATGTALPAQFTQATGFTTTTPNLCNGSVVISQVFGGGASSASVPNADYIELHNRGTTAVTMTNWSVQYASAAGSSWLVQSFTGTIQPGAYFLIRTQATGTGTPLPTPDATGTALAMSGTAGKVALVNNATALSSVTCPTNASIVDFVGYGTTANCSEGAGATAAPTSATAVLRVQAGCGDVNNNVADFATAAPAPRNSATTSACACSVQNETSVPNVEADYCAVQSPLSLNVAAGTSTGNVYGQVYEASTTEAAGAAGNVRAQLGWGLASSNPQYQSGWTWTNATYNVQSGNNDEYQASFIAPASGSYRYVYRFSLDQGVSWTYCDGAFDDGGGGANAGLSFEFSSMPILTVP